MSNEISMDLALRFAKGVLSDGEAFTALQATMSGSNWTHATQTIGTSEEAIAKGDVGTPGFFLVQNLDNTNYVTFRASSGAADTIKLKPGEASVFRWASSNPYAIANAGAVKIKFLMLED